ncbi:MAG TPA: SpoIIE family protein phosphatase [Chitinivibrionales bacterium]
MNNASKPAVDVVAALSALSRMINRLQRELAGNGGYEIFREIVGQIRQQAYTLKNQAPALVFQEQLLGTLMENIPDSIFFKDTQSRFLRVNKAWAKRRGIQNPEEAIGKTDFDFFPKESAQSFFNDEQKIIKSGKPLVGRVQYLHLPGMEPRWISITKIPLVDPKTKAIIGTCGISHDVSLSTKIEEELAKERDMLHLLLDNSPDAIYFKDRESRFLRISKAQAEMFKCANPAEAIGKTDFDFFNLEHAQDAFNDEKKIIRTKKPIVGKIERETASGRSERWVTTTKMPIIDKNNSVIGTFGMSRDITELKKFENALQTAKDELEVRVKERTTDLQKANKDLQSRIAQLDFITSISYDMAQRINIDELVPVILRSFTSRLPGAIAGCCLWTEKGFFCIAATGPLNSAEGKKACEQALGVFHTMPLHRPFTVEKWQSDDHLSQFSWPSMEDLSFYTAIPMLADNHLMAIIQIFANKEAQPLYKDEEKVLATLATQSAVSLSNALHYKELGEKARLQGELDAARSIQQRLTPNWKPSIPRVSLKGVYYPAFEVGGDYLDYFKTENGQWVVVIADVCGKGVPAALLMTILRSAFRVEARGKTSAKELLCSVNESMRVNLDDRSFVTAICLIISDSGESMSYARAGHPKLIRIPANGAAVETIESNGIALGFISDYAAFSGFVEEITIPLATGDRFLIYTDGLTEAVNNEKDAYGNKRLSDLLSGDIGESPEAMLDTIMNDVKLFTCGAPYHDDLTIIALKVTGDA